MQDQIQGGGGVCRNAEISRQVIAGTGGDVAENYSGRIGYALQGLVYGAVAAQEDELHRSFRRRRDFSSDSGHISGLSGKVRLVGDASTQESRLYLFLPDFHALAGTGGRIDDDMIHGAPLLLCFLSILSGMPGLVKEQNIFPDTIWCCLNDLWRVWESVFLYQI